MRKVASLACVAGFRPRMETGEATPAEIVIDDERKSAAFSGLAKGENTAADPLHAFLAGEELAAGEKSRR